MNLWLPEGREGERDGWRVWDRHVHTAVFKMDNHARFGSTYTKIGTIQRRLAWPLHKDDMQIREAFHIFRNY